MGVFIDESCPSIMILNLVSECLILESSKSSLLVNFLQKVYFRSRKADLPVRLRDAGNTVLAENNTGSALALESFIAPSQLRLKRLEILFSAPLALVSRGILVNRTVVYLGELHAGVILLLDANTRDYSACSAVHVSPFMKIIADRACAKTDFPHRLRLEYSVPGAPEEIITFWVRSRAELEGWRRALQTAKNTVSNHYIDTL